MQNDKRKKFVKIVKEYYKKYGRHELPWRQTSDPYHILVSEMMLQQTQVARVIPKYEAFLKRFPTVRHLAQAPLSDVLVLWSGLGYNRRARFIHESAKFCVATYNGVFPQDTALLESFPGIGTYTARAVMAFAWNKPVVFIETNIRTVFIQSFFSTKKEVSDTTLIRYVEETLDTKNPRAWYAALMDYGSYLKTQGNTVHRKSAHYKKQPAFKGSRRAIRGAIIKSVLSAPQKVSALIIEYGTQTSSVLDDLIKEGFITKSRGYVRTVM